MKQNRRQPGIALAAFGVATALALSGCTSGDADEATTLTVWHYYNTDGQVGALERLAERFQEDHSDVEVELVYVPVEQFTNRAVTAASAQTGPDVLVYGASGTYDLASSGAIPSMDEWWSGYADKDQFPEGVMQRVDGELYGVQGYVNLIGLWYNEDMLAELGAEVPETITEMEAVMAKAVAAGKQGVTLTGVPGLESQWQGFPWFTSHGFSYGDPQAEPMADTFAMLQDWVANGYLSAEASSWDQTVPFQHFLAESAPLAVNGNWQINAAKDASFSYAVAPLPLTASGGVLLGGEVQNIGAFSKNPELAREFVETTFFSAEGQLLLLESFGTIPARGDAAASSLISDDPILSAFVEIVQRQGRPSPSPDVPSSNVNEVENTVGNFWSRAIARDGTPEQLATQLLDQLMPLLKG